MNKVHDSRTRMCMTLGDNIACDCATRLFLIIIKTMTMAIYVNSIYACIVHNFATPHLIQHSPYIITIYWRSACTTKIEYNALSEIAHFYDGHCQSIIYVRIYRGFAKSVFTIYYNTNSFAHCWVGQLILWCALHRDVRCAYE